MLLFYYIMNKIKLMRLAITALTSKDVQNIKKQLCKMVFDRKQKKNFNIEFNKSFVKSFIGSFQNQG